MPTSRFSSEQLRVIQNEAYRDGYRAGLEDASGARLIDVPKSYDPGATIRRSKPKRKLSPWNKFVKANAKKPRFRLRSGSPNLKKLGVAFRKTPAGKKKR
jgi:hypothetical protein